VKKLGVTLGRPYYHCATRSCSFFLWADGGNFASSLKMDWRRCREGDGWRICTNAAGFQARDLQQGAIGDCWFMSALAVVAERPDLLLKLIPNPSMSSSGRYGVNLFIDGTWGQVEVDDHFPFVAGGGGALTMVEGGIDGATGLAYCRGRGKQLWPPLIEKAYAKMYGSYSSISGGHISEALMDLTGCPSETYNFDDRGFSPEAFWKKLLLYSALELPMGCATSVDPALKEMGLVGMHAYSVLEAKEMSPSLCRDPADLASLGIGLCPETGLLRMVRVRNPHGDGGSEWKGMFSDSDHTVGGFGQAELNRTGKQDGTFWMNYRDFLMGFCLVDVSLAYRGICSVSLERNLFPVKDKSCNGRRSGSAFYELQIESTPVSPGPAAPPRELHVMLVQPSKRGAFCRGDRKRSYKPGDSAIFLLLKRENESPRVVAASIYGRDRFSHLKYMLPPGRVKLQIVTMSFGSGPSATGVTGEKVVRNAQSPFVLRLSCTAQFKVERHESTPQKRVSPALAEAICLSAALSHQLQIHKHQKSQVGGAVGELELHTLTLENSAFIYGVNRSKGSKHVTLEILGKGIEVRTLHNGIESSTVLPNQPRVKYAPVSRQFSISEGLSIPAGHTRLLAVVMPTGFMWSLEKISAVVIQKTGTQASIQASLQSRLPFAGSAESNSPFGIFRSVLMEEARFLAENRRRGGIGSIGGFDEQDLIEATIAESLVDGGAARGGGAESEIEEAIRRSLEEDKPPAGSTDSRIVVDADLEAAIRMSMQAEERNSEAPIVLDDDDVVDIVPQPEDRGLAVQSVDQEDDEMKQAIQMSLAGGTALETSKKAKNVSEEEEDYAIRMKRLRDDWKKEREIHKAVEHATRPSPAPQLDSHKKKRSAIPEDHPVDSSTENVSNNNNDIGNNNSEVAADLDTSVVDLNSSVDESPVAHRVSVVDVVDLCGSDSEEGEDDDFYS